MTRRTGLLAFNYRELPGGCCVSNRNQVNVPFLNKKPVEVADLISQVQVVAAGWELQITEIRVDVRERQLRNTLAKYFPGINVTCRDSFGVVLSFASVHEAS